MSIVVTLLRALLFTLLISQALNSTQQNLVRVQGVILDLTDARILHARIILQSRKLRYIFQSDNEGLFDVKVPEGTYQLVVDAHHFEVFRIKRLEVKGKGIIGMNIHLKVGHNREETIYEPVEGPIEPQKAPVGKKIGPRKIQ